MIARMGAMDARQSGIGTGSVVPALETASPADKG
jgi:hypothetical protein